MNIFNQVDSPKVKSANFNLSEEMKLSCNMGDLVPICMKEVLPSDKIKIDTELLIKFAPLAAPVMHRIKAYVHYFFVPMYQLTGQFEKFINPKVNDGSILLPTFTPQDCDSDDFKIGSLADYLGLPIVNDGFANSEYALSVLPFAAYQHIYNSYYRDQNLELLPEEGGTSLADIEALKALTSGDITSITNFENFFALRKRAWAKDYFTSALPSPQAGDDVLIPIQSNVIADGKFTFKPWGYEDEATSFDAKIGGEDSDLGVGVLGVEGDTSDHGLEFKSGLKAVNGSATINDLRKAMALQRFKELAERGGTRYPEFVRNFFHAILPDWYVDRPIFLGGNKQPISIGEVVQTSQTTTGEDASALAHRGGIASSYGRSKSAYLKAPCHGFLVGILSIRPEATYQQGLERMWSRSSIFDYPFPQFANIGEQEILNKEIFWQGNDSDDGVFGYTPRYAEWKEGHTHVCGEFRTSLAYWHFGRQFENLPTLSKQFVMMEDVNTDPFLVTDDSTEHVYVNLYNNIHARRPLPYFGTPSIL